VSVDGVGGIPAGSVDLAALLDAELAQLAADAQALRGLLIEGAVVTARVLPSNGLTDLLDIAGRRVAASLPPTLTPGDVVQVQVTGFDGDRILMQVVGTEAGAPLEAGPPPPSAPPSVAPPPSVSAPPPGSAPPLAASAPAPPTPATAMPGPAARGTAGPAFESVVVRATVAGPSSAPVRPMPSSPSAPAAAVDPARALEPPPAAAPPPARAAVPLPPGAAADVGIEPRSDGTPALRAPTPPLPQRPVVIETATTSIEARLDAVRASSAPASPSPGAAAVPTPAAAPAQPPFVLPPPIAAKAVPLPRPAPANYAEPAALLRALRLPVTPSNVASATMALERPGALAGALAALEAALPRTGDDPNVATLRTLLAFVGRIDPQSPALAAQLEAFVEHVVDGTEPKVATMLAARSVVAAAPDAPVAAAVAAERGAALAVDLKATLLAMASDPATPAALAPSLAGALSAITAAQLSAAQALATNPNGVALTIPLTTPHGHANARITVARDAPDRGRVSAVDPSNFRIAFVLETAHYGTVGIDLVTVGRDVSVDVRTESAIAMRAFRDALGALTARLESLRYRVASAAASVGSAATVAVDAPPAAPTDRDATVDRSA